MKLWCATCKTYTEHATLSYVPSNRDILSGRRSDVRTMECQGCHGKKTVDLAPDER